MRRISLVLVGMLVGCTRPPAEPVRSAAETTPKITIVHPQRRALKRFVEQPGTVRAYEEAPLFAKFAGFIRVVHVDIGDRVVGPVQDSDGKWIKPGQVLAEITIPEIEEEARHKDALVAQAQVAVAQARKQLAIFEAQIAAAEAAAREARAGLKRSEASFLRWQSETRRLESLVKSRVIDQQTHEEALNQFRAAEASREEAEAHILTADAAVREARAKRDKAVTDIEAAEAHLTVSRAEAGRLAALVGYTQLRAPFDGVVTRRYLDAGHFVQPASSGSMREPLLNIMRLDPVRVAIDVPESDAALVGKGTSARIAVPALRSQQFQGVVARTSEALDHASRTLRAEIDVPNPDSRLKPGMYVYVTLAVQQPEAWTLPVRGILRQDEHVNCFRVVENRLVKTALRIGDKDSELVEVIAYRVGDEWREFTGQEEFAAAAAGLTDGQELPSP